MFGGRLISKNCFRKFSFGEVRFRFIFGEFKKCKKSRNIRFYHKTMSSYPYKYIALSRLNNATDCSTFRYNSTQATFELKNEDNQQINSYFKETMHHRKLQACRSLLIEINKKEDIPFAVAYCQKFGSISNAYSYSGESENCFLLLEFSSEIATQKLLLNCQCKNIADAFPVCSRLIHFEKMVDAALPAININVNEENIARSSLKPGANFSEVIEDIYTTEKLTELDTRLRFFFCTLIKDSVSGLFPHCDVMPFGSSVNGIGRHGCDLDVMIRLYPAEVNGNGELFFLNKTCIGKHKNFQQKVVSCLGEYIRTFFPGISSVEKIMFARVPILKMNHRILKIECDLSVNNMSAVYMSNIVHYCGEIDSRVRPLMYAVKKWAKETKITHHAPGYWISNFGLINLILFFLQNRPDPILPPFKDVFVIVGEDNSFEFRVQYLKSIEEWKNRASINKESLAVLLKEFLSFLANDPFEENIISLMTGSKRSRSDSIEPLYVQYPFDESLNITKNVSIFEFQSMREKAKISVEYLENNVKQKVNYAKDFSLMLGIPSINRRGRSQKIDVSSLIQDEKGPKKKTVKHRAL